MPLLIIILGLASLVIILGGYAIQEISRPYPEDKNAKHQSRLDAERIRRHAERDAILAHAEIIDQRTKVELTRQYMRDQYPPGTPIPDIPMPDLPPDPRERMDDFVPEGEVRHRIERPVREETETPDVPDTRDLRAALRARKQAQEEPVVGADTSDTDRAGRLKDALAGRGRPEEPDDAAGPEQEPDAPDTRAGILKANLAKRAGAKKVKPAKPAKAGKGLFGRKQDPETDQDENGEIPETPAPRIRIDPDTITSDMDVVPDTEPEGAIPDVPDTEPEEAPTEEKPEPKKGLFGRKRKPAKPENSESEEAEEAGHDKPKHGLFGKRAKQEVPDEPEQALTESAESEEAEEVKHDKPAKPKRGLFGKKAKQEIPDETEQETGPAPQETAKPKKRGLFGKKPKQEDPSEDDTELTEHTEASDEESGMRREFGTDDEPDAASAAEWLRPSSVQDEDDPDVIPEDPEPAKRPESTIPVMDESMDEPVPEEEQDPSDEDDLEPTDDLEPVDDDE